MATDMKAAASTAASAAPAGVGAKSKSQKGVPPTGRASQCAEFPKINVLRFMTEPKLLGPWFQGSSWDTWRAILKAAFALPLTPAELAVFRAVAERDPPTQSVKELWIIAGRRAGKDSIASLIATFFAASFPHQQYLRPGERALVQCLAVDRDQARILLNYIRAYFAEVPLLQTLLMGETKNGLQLNNGADVAVNTNDFKAVRGRTVAISTFDECAYWLDERSANPDVETYAAVKPSLMTLPYSMLVGISSPYKRGGLLYERWSKHYGEPGDVLVVRAPSIVLNPTLDRDAIAAEIAADPAAASEWDAVWRSDISAYIDRAVVEAAVIRGRRELPPARGVHFVGAFDGAGGGGADSFASAIAYKDPFSGHAVLAAVRETRPPFSPQATIEEHAAFFRSYGVETVISDRWAGMFPSEQFRQNSVMCEFSPLAKSEIYKELIGPLNSGQVELLDNDRLISQLANLERRTGRSGRDTVDHPTNGHDDVINAAAIALVSALTSAGRNSIAFASIRGPMADFHAQRRRGGSYL